jgi:hypothetical protein
MEVGGNKPFVGQNGRTAEWRDGKEGNMGILLVTLFRLGPNLRMG